MFKNELLGELMKYLSLLSNGLSIFAAIGATYIAKKAYDESKESRKQEVRPHIHLKNFQFAVSSKLNHDKREVTCSCSNKLVENNSYPEIVANNIGLGPALDIRYEWKYNLNMLKKPKYTTTLKNNGEYSPDYYDQFGHWFKYKDEFISTNFYLGDSYMDLFRKPEKLFQTNVAPKDHTFSILLPNNLKEIIKVYIYESMKSDYINNYADILNEIFESTKLELKLIYKDMLGYEHQQIFSMTIVFNNNNLRRLDTDDAKIEFDYFIHEEF